MVAQSSSVYVRDTGGGIGGDLFMDGGNASTRLKLFFIFKTVLLNDFWIFADLGKARNLIAEETFIKLPF